MNAIRHIRKSVFKVRQADFAVIAGVTQATVSRWERGELTPSLAELAKIREAAAGRRIKWHDRLFFEAPATTGAAA